MKAFTSSLLAVFAQAAYYTINDQTDCEAFAALFSNTAGCDNSDESVWDISTAVGTSFTCSGNDQVCASSSSVTNSPCTHSQKLCVSCKTDLGDVYIRVRSNQMPSHCYRSFTTETDGGTEPQYADPTVLDFEVKFNRDVQDFRTVDENDIDDSFKATTLLCDADAAAASNLPGSTGFSNNEGVQSEMVAVALDGIRINYPFVDLDDFVAVFNEKMDMCLTYTTDENTLVYHSLSPCILNGSATQTPELCEDNGVCKEYQGPWNVARDAWTSTANHGGTVGLARDGHVIYGPYNENGELWACDEHDICNGVFFDNGQYAYVATPTYPYLVGCYGPGEIQYYPVEDSCSANPKCFACNVSVGLTTIAAILAILYV